MKKILFLIVFTLVLSLGLESNVYAANRVNGYVMGSIFHARKNDGYFSKYGQLLDYRVIDGDYAGKKAYCFAPSEDLNQNVDYEIVSYNDGDLLNKINETQKENSNKITQEQLNKIMLYAYYGYDYKDRNTDDYKIATQMLVYRSIENQVFTDVLCSNKNCYEKQIYVDEMNNIQKDVDKHYVKPSFDGFTFNIKLHKSVQVRDYNEVLDDFEVSSCENCTAHINGNLIDITATNVGKIKLTLVKKKNYQNDLIFLTSSQSQNMVVPGNVAPVYTTVYGNVLSGNIEVTKVGEEGEALSGAKFNVYNSDDDLVCSLTTKANGKDNCANLEIGDYYMVEDTAPLGYVLDTTRYDFTITVRDTDITKTIRNEKIRGDVELYKEDKDTKIAQGDATLKGAVYGIYKSDGTKIADVTTDENGYFKYEDLEYGSYYIKEIKPSLGYLLDETRYDFQIRNNGEVIKVTSKEEVQKFDFKLLKTMSNGASGVVEVEEEAVFQIFDNKSGKYVKDIVTDNKGKAKVTLPYGTYKVCQKKGSGKTLMASCFVITLHEDLEKVVNNEFIKAKIKILKIDEDSKKVIPLKGIKFKIKNLDTGEYICQSVTYPEAKKYCVFETNNEGILITPDYLQAGRYQLEEVDQMILGYLWNSEPLVFTIDDKANIVLDEDYGYILEVRFANKEVLGSIQVYKTGEVFNVKDGNISYDEKALEGVKFEVYDENKKLVGIIVTDQEGFGVLENLKLGKYYLKEVSTIDDYLLDDNWYTINLEYQDQYTALVTERIDLKNKLIKGTINIVKKDDIGNPLEGVKFKLYDENNNLIGIYITNEEGIINLELPYGKYYLEEIITKVGYKIDEEIKEINLNREDVSIQLINERLFTKVNLLKVNNLGEPLKGVKFNLFDINNNLIGTYITDEDGYIRLELPYGEYYFQEIETINGYFLDDKKLEFKVDSSEEINLTYENYKKIRVPSTSSNVDYKLGILLGLSSLIIINSNKFKKKWWLFN